MKTVPLIGYSSHLSGRSGNSINFMVSSEHKENYTAQLFRSVSADPNPNGIGLLEHACDDIFPKQSFLSRKQVFYPGSYGITEKPLSLGAKHQLTFSVLIYPTLLCTNAQSIIDFGHFGLSLNAEGQVVVRAGQEAVTSLEKVSLRCWYSIVAKIGVSGRISIALATLENGQNYQLIH